MPTSIHSESITDIHEVPLTEIQRPLQSQVDEEKVRSLMETLQVGKDTFSEVEKF